MNVKSKNCFAFCHMITTFAFKIAHDWLRYEFIIIMKRFVSRWFSGPFVKYFNYCCHSFCIGIHILIVLNRIQEQYRKLQEKTKTDGTATERWQFQERDVTPITSVTCRSNTTVEIRTSETTPRAPRTVSFR